MVRKLTDGKNNIIAGLIQEYNIQTANDIQEMLETELDSHLGYDSYDRSDNTDYRNGMKPKKLKSSYQERINGHRTH